MGLLLLRAPVRLGLVIYGSLEELSGGFLYDRRLKVGLEARGHHVKIVALPWRSYLPSLTDNLDRRLLVRLAEAGFDVLLQDELCHPSLFLLNRRLPEQLPLVTIVHHLRSSERHPRPARWLYRLIEHSYLRSVDGFVHNSQSTRSSVHSLLGQPSSEVVAPPGRDHLDGTSPPTSRAQNPAGDPLHILFVGGLIPRKGLHVLLDALEGLEGKWQLAVAGRSDLDPEYARSQLQRLHSPPLAEASRFHGAVHSDDLRQLYRQADVLAVPSLHEGFGIVYLEAMGYGLPVLASRSGGASELVSHAENGFLIEPGSAADVRKALRRYQDHPSLLAAHGAAAMARFEQHPTWQDSAEIASRYLETWSGRKEGK